MYTYKDYAKEPGILTFTEMQTLHDDMISEIGTDPKALELYRELTNKAAEYAAIRSTWLSLSPEEKIEQDPRRTSCHDSLIIKFNMLARYQKMQGKSVTWRDTLGYEPDDIHARKRIGDFACFIVFINALNAR